MAKETKIGRLLEEHHEKTDSKAKIFNDVELDKIETLGAVLSIEQIADYFGIGKATIYRIFERQPESLRRYKKGKSKAISIVASNLIIQAKGGNLTASIFYLKTQGGWKEKQEIDHTSSDGTMSPRENDKAVIEAIKNKYKNDTE